MCCNQIAGEPKLGIIRNKNNMVMIRWSFFSLVVKLVKKRKEEQYCSTTYDLWPIDPKISRYLPFQVEIVSLNGTLEYCIERQRSNARINRNNRNLGLGMA
jgi:hypothetical protein